MEKKKVEVEVVVTLAKKVQIEMSEEDIKAMEDDNCLLDDLVKEQIVMPQNAWRELILHTYIANTASSDSARKAMEDLRDWDVVDMQPTADLL